jgi:hypothetical protein
MVTQVERLARVEEQVKYLREDVDELKRHIKDQSQKLDDLLMLRSKGIGAFWLASTVLGTGIIGAFFQLMHWFKGH